MALSRKSLSAMGIDEDKIDQIIEMHTETVNALKDERDQYKSDAGKLKTVQKELDDMKKAAEAGDRSPYKVKYEAAIEDKNNLQKEFDDYKAEQVAKETKRQKQDAYTALLKGIGVSEKRIGSIIKITDLEKLELEDGELKDADKLKDSAKKEWADFIVTETHAGAKTPTPPGGSGGTGKTKEEIMKIKDPKERQTEIARNHELFGF